jgi:hypothetical protein
MVAFLSLEVNEPAVRGLAVETLRVFITSKT